MLAKNQCKFNNKKLSVLLSVVLLNVTFLFIKINETKRQHANLKQLKVSSQDPERHRNSQKKKKKKKWLEIVSQSNTRPNKPMRSLWSNSGSVKSVDSAAGLSLRPEHGSTVWTSLCFHVVPASTDPRVFTAAFSPQPGLAVPVTSCLCFRSPPVHYQSCC